MSRKTKTSQGFTIVELMLSMAFIGVMLVAIALCVIQISTIYSRGETVRQVNQATRTIVEDIESTVAASHPFDVEQSEIDAGRLCTGRYTYVWSTLTHVNVDTTGAMVRFARVGDPGRLLCSNTSAPVVRANAVELLEASDRSLRVHSFAITPVAAVTEAGQRLYTVTILVGTDNAAAINTTTSRCRPPSEADADLTYCAINEFTITVRAGIR